MEGLAIVTGFVTEPYHSELVHEIFEKFVKKHGDDTALISGDVIITYSELNRKANKVANYLLNFVSSSDAIANADSDWIVAISAEPGVNVIATLIGVFKTGCAYVPLDPTFPEGRISHILKDSRPFCILKSGLQPVLDAVEDIQVFDIDDILKESANDENPDYVLEAFNERVGIVMYTSGSTGIPKGVRIPHRAIISRLSWQARVFPFGKSEVCCFKTALTFVDSVAEIFAPLLNGIPLVVVQKADVKDPEELISLLSRNRVSRLVLVPSLLRSILTMLESPESLNCLKFWICSGEILGLELVETFFAKFGKSCALANFYGSTEVMGDVTYAVMRSWEEAEEIMVNKKVPIGISVDNCNVYLLDSQLEVVQGQSQGEIYVAGRHVALGYVGGKGSEKFVKNSYSTSKEYEVLFRTGDFARVINHQLIYEGRADSQIKVRGHRVDLAEVERCVKSIDAVEAGTVLCYKPGELEQEVVAFVVLKKKAQTDVLRENLLKSLPAYMMPQIVQVEVIPLLVNGKVDRQSLLKSHEKTLQNKCDRPVDVSDVPTCQRELAVKIIRTISHCLGSSIIGEPKIDQNFFDVGGNSLNAIKVVMKLREQGLDLKIGDFLLAKTLRNLLDGLINQSDEDSLHPKMSESLHEDDGEEKMMYTVEILNDFHKEIVLKIIADSFSVRGDLEKLAGVTYQDFYDVMNDIWDTVVQKKLSFALKSSDGSIASVAINFDAYDEPPFYPSKNLAYVLDFLESVEASVRNRLPEGTGKVFHCLLMGTDLALPAHVNVRLIQEMEEQNIVLAKQRGFECVFTTNTSDLTRDMCDDVLNYDVLAEVLIHNHVAADGVLPFKSANLAQKVVATIKWI